MAQWPLMLSHQLNCEILPSGQHPIITSLSRPLLNSSIEQEKQNWCTKILRTKERTFIPPVEENISTVLDSAEVTNKRSEYPSTLYQRRPKRG